MSKPDFVIELDAPEAKIAPDAWKLPPTRYDSTKKPSYEEVREFVSLDGTANLVEVYETDGGTQVIGNEEARYGSTFLNPEASRIVGGEWVGPAWILSGDAKWD